MKKYQRPEIGYNRKSVAAIPLAAALGPALATLSTAATAVGIGLGAASKLLGDDKNVNHISSLDEVIA